VGDYGRPIEFGLSLVPNAAEVAEARELAVRADASGLELLAIQDHPYQWRYVETWTLMTDLLARTQRIRVFSDVANLPLHLPAMIAKQAASLDVLSGGRFELGLGAGAYWEAIGAMGGPIRSRRESLEAHEEAIRIIRLFWSGERTISFEGRYYSVSGLHPGPPPAHPIGIWLGVYKPRALALTGRMADGWLSPLMSYAPPEGAPDLQRRIDEAAAEAGRRPAEIRRVYNLPGEITDAPTGELLQGPVEHWVETLTGFALELGFDTFILWPGGGDAPRQVERFAQEVAPQVREEVERTRGRSAA
jgi:alkanesulfonate monooxygenase SsuD/methylene tetrahydromethanopterin reductase-like flavin-dependent oxidoreductase (luciferase family)